MLQPLSNDLRLRFVDFVEKDHSRREPAARFKAAASNAVNIVKLWKDTGKVEPLMRGGYRHGKLKPHKAFILGVIAKQPYNTMPELAQVLASEKTRLD